MSGEISFGRLGQARAKVDSGQLRFVDETGKLRREPPCPVRRPGGAPGAVHRQNHSGQHGQALGRIDGGRQIEGAAERERRLVETAERGDSWQQHRPPIREPQERLRQCAGSPASWQQHEPTRDGKRVPLAAVHPLAGHRVQKWDMRRDGEKIYRVSPVAPRLRRYSAWDRSAGVERWNHSPSCTTARRRPRSRARFHSTFI